MWIHSQVRLFLNTCFFYKNTKLFFYRAPTDCLQYYYTGSAGEVKSFNFGGGVQLRDTQYTLCVRREQGMLLIRG
jgi:hypothetical protein